MYGVAGDKATDLDQIGRFLFNFGNPTYTPYAFKRTKVVTLYILGTKKTYLIKFFGRWSYVRIYKPFIDNRQKSHKTWKFHPEFNKNIVISSSIHQKG